MASSSANFLEECISVMANSAASLPAKDFSAVQFSENAHFIRLSVDLPGVLHKDLAVELQRGVLLVRGLRETPLAKGIRHQHRFCRRFALDTDVVDSTKLKANLNQQGVLTIMAPKKSLPTTMPIVVTEQDDETFEHSVMESHMVNQQKKKEKKKEQEETIDVDAEETKEEEEAKPAKRKLEETLKITTAEPRSTAAAPAAGLPNVVSMGSTSDILGAARGMNSLRGGEKNMSFPVKRSHKSSLQSHLMIRRSQSKRSMH